MKLIELNKLVKSRKGYFKVYPKAMTKSGSEQRKIFKELGIKEY